MSEVRRVCRQTGRWASIEGGRCRSDCSVLPHVVPETARSSSAGLVQPVGSGPACVFEMQLRQIQPARCWSSYIRCCPNLGWDGALLTPFTPNPPTSNPRSSAPGDELRNENKVEKGTKCYTADVISLEQMVLLGAQGLPSLCCSENPHASVAVLMQPPSTCINGAMPRKDSVPFKWAVQIHRAHRKNTSHVAEDVSCLVPKHNLRYSSAPHQLPQVCFGTTLQPKYKP